MVERCRCPVQVWGWTTRAQAAMQGSSRSTARLNTSGDKHLPVGSLPINVQPLIKQQPPASDSLIRSHTLFAS